MPRKTTLQEDRDFSKALVDMMSLDAKDILEYVQEHFEPEDVFPDSQLEAWAVDHGFVFKPDDDDEAKVRY